jgi:hypothetical protein
VLACLLCSSPVHAGDREEIARDSPALTVALQENFKGTELLQAFREVENGKECYSVRLRSGGQMLEYYISPDGHSLIFKNQVFSLERMPERLAGCLIISLFPCALAGACSRWLCQASSATKMTVFSEWLSAWVGAVIALGMVLLVFKHARYRDVPIEACECFIFGVISASFVEALGLMAQSTRGYRRWILGFCTLATLSIVMQQFVGMLGMERENQHNRQIMMREPLGQSQVRISFRAERYFHSLCCDNEILTSPKSCRDYSSTRALWWTNARSAYGSSLSSNVPIVPRREHPA